MKKENCELYLSNDIVQGENVPFYLLWKAIDIKEINIKFSGFDKVSEYYNVKKRFPKKKTKILIDDIKRGNYFGGSLKTSKSTEPFKKGFLKITILKTDGKRIELLEERTLFTTFLEIVPRKSDTVDLLDSPLLNIQLNGSTTIFIDVMCDEDSDLKLILPLEIKSSMEKFLDVLSTEIDKLKQKYPNNPILELLSDLFLHPKAITRQNFLERVGFALNNYTPSEDFKEALGIVFFNAIHVESNMLNLIIRPLMEYLESSAAKKAFLNSPFLTLEVLEGRNLFKGKILYQNILEREDVYESKNYGQIPFKMTINNKEKRIIPFKDLISIKRVENAKF
jgi:hypothetical protein